MNIEQSIQQYMKKHGYGAFCPKAVLFDMDGVLYNSMPNHATSWHRSMQQCGLDMPESDAYKYEGMRGVETIKLLARQQWNRELTDEEAQRMYDIKSAMFAACPPAPKMEGVEQLMHKMKASGLLIGIVTGSGQRTLLDRLEQAFPGLIEQKRIVTSFDVTHGKPHPEPYLQGLRKVGAKPWEAMVVENAPLGIEAAVRAGIFTIAVNSGPLPSQMLADAGASLIYESMPALRDDWERLIAKLRQPCHL